MSRRPPKIRPLPSRTRLLELLRYDRNTGILTWRVGRPGASKGSVAGTRKKCGRSVVTIDGIQYQAHRIGWKMFTGKEPPASLDHWDRNPGNNRFANLRAADRSQNGGNGKRHKNNVSGFRGVSPRYSGGQERNRRERGMQNRPVRSWRAQIKHRGRVMHLGEYKTREEAHAIYIFHAMIYHGFFASDGEEQGEGGRFAYISRMLKYLSVGQEKGERA